jgi:uncharacterized pyridoxal phosphate-containing UPF0001 family protein
MTTIAANLQAVRSVLPRRQSAGTTPKASPCWRSARPGRGACDARSGGGRAAAFGENYVQEGIARSRRLPARAGVAFHRPAAEQQDPPGRRTFRLGALHRTAEDCRALSGNARHNPAAAQVCVQVNVSGEASKSGVSAGGRSARWRKPSRPCPTCGLRGLMAIPEPTEDMPARQDAASPLRELREAQRAAGWPLDTLSMGMSHDLEAAIPKGRRSCASARPFLVKETRA